MTFRNRIDVCDYVFFSNIKLKTMPKKSNYPEGKKKTIKVDINSDFQKEMTKEITEVRKKYWIDNKNNETETEYNQRIKKMHE